MYDFYTIFSQQNVFLKIKDRILDQTFIFCFLYHIHVDDILLLNYSLFGDHVHIIYPNELEIKFTTDTQNCCFLH
jgi:hypothetical protein